jgi:ribosomal protein S18 acetylase RimI-like enzyme
MDIQIRPATIADAPDLQRIASATFPMACPPHTAPLELATYIAENLSACRFRQMLADGGTSVLCASGDGQLGGFAVVNHKARLPLDDDDDERGSELQKLYVAPHYHGSGLAQNLMLAVFDAATKAGSRQVFLGVYSGNGRAKRFYSKLGFVEVGRTEFRMGSEVHLDSVMLASVV